MDTEEKAKLLAKYEIGWWKAHHRKDKESFIQNMVNLYELQFGIKRSIAVSAVYARLEAADYHDVAEKKEDGGYQDEADIYWKKHFEILEKGELN